MSDIKTIGAVAPRNRSGQENPAFLYPAPEPENTPMVIMTRCTVSSTQTSGGTTSELIVQSFTFGNCGVKIMNKREKPLYSITQPMNKAVKIGMLYV